LSIHVSGDERRVNNAGHSKKLLFESIFWPLFFVFILVSFIAALNWLSSLDLDPTLLRDISYPHILAAILLQGVANIFITLAWQGNMRRHGVNHLGFLPSAVMVGIQAIGKYTPGKLLGVVARGTALYRITGNTKVSVQTAIVEQVALFHSGAVIAALAFIAEAFSITLFILVSLAGMVSIFAVSRMDKLIFGVIARFRRSKKQEEIQYDETFKRSYPLVFMYLTVVWVTSAGVMYFCIGAFRQSLGLAEIFEVTTLAYLSGFTAFFSLAGLGVREGVIVAMLNSTAGLGTAIYISITHRLVTLVLDLMMGLLALVAGKPYLRAKDDGTS
jgi:uncharacterized membrane protein YbhN (UPF0104 family)